MKLCKRCGQPGTFRVDPDGERHTCRACENKARRDRRAGLNSPGRLDGSTFDTSPVDEDRTIDGPVNDQAPWPHGSGMTGAAPDGFTVRGVSTLYDASGEVKAQWVKSSRQEEDRLKAFEEAVQRIAEPFRGVANPTPSPATLDDDLMVALIAGDPHVGLYSWAQETGSDFNLETAESNLVTAVDHLVALGPAAKTALIVNLGDFFHSDTSDNRTARSGHALDVDTRWAKVLSVGIRIMRRCIDRALEKHETVKVINAIGNHDDHSAVMLSLCLANYYEREPRVHIDTSPGKFYWHRFGDNLIGVTHGDTCKMERLPGVMATDRARDWGETVNRVWYTGHIHHESVKEYPGVTVESFRTLAAPDAWHAASGYRSGRDMKMDVWHRRWGRINRHVVGIRQIWAKAS